MNKRVLYENRSHARISFATNGISRSCISVFGTVMLRGKVYGIDFWLKESEVGGIGIR